MRKRALAAVLTLSVGVGVGGCSSNGDADTSPPRPAPSDRTAASCRYSENAIDPRDDHLSDAQERRRDAKQPAVLAVNEGGDTVCAYVHNTCAPGSRRCGAFLYLRGSKRLLPVTRDGVIEVRFESPVEDFTPNFPETCGLARDIAPVDGRGAAWRFRMPTDLEATDCFSSTFSLDARYGAAGRFAGYVAGYGLTVDVTDAKTFDERTE